MYTRLDRLRSYSSTIIVIALCIVLVALAFLGRPTGAVEAAEAANTLKVSPVRSDIVVEPGKSTVVKAVVSNLTNEPITLQPTTNDFISGDESGTPALLLDENQFAPSHSLKRFMGTLEPVTIPAGEGTSVDVTITVPEDAEAGGYFGAVRFSPATPDSGGQVNLSASVASLILLTVPGELVEQLSLTNFDVQQDGKTGTFFNGSENLQVLARFKSEGNVQAGPFGKISVSQGNNVVYEEDFNNKTPKDVILPDGARRWEIPIEKLGGIGQYTVNATFTYGADNKSIQVEKTFWVIPMTLIIGVIVAAIVLIALIVLAVVLLRRRSKRTRIRGSRRRR